MVVSKWVDKTMVGLRPGAAVSAAHRGDDDIGHGNEDAHTGADGQMRSTQKKGAGRGKRFCEAVLFVMADDVGLAGTNVVFLVHVFAVKQDYHVGVLF